MKLLAVPFALFVLACGSPTLPDGFEERLVTEGLCGEYVYAGSEADDLLLVYKAVVGFDALAGAGEQVHDFATTNAGAVLYVETGARLLGGFCGEAIPDTDRRYHPVSGAGTFLVTSSGGSGYQVTLHLENISFAEEHGDDDALLGLLDLGPLSTAP